MLFYAKPYFQHERDRDIPMVKFSCCCKDLFSSCEQVEKLSFKPPSKVLALLQALSLTLSLSHLEIRLKCPKDGCDCL